MIRIALMMAMCAVLWLSLDYVAKGIAATIVYAQTHGYRVTNIPDLFKVFGFEGVRLLGGYAIALVAAVLAGVFALIAQLHMLLSAHATTASNPQDWRVRLLAFMGNRSGALAFVGLILLSLLSLGMASDWLFETLGRVPGG